MTKIKKKTVRVSKLCDSATEMGTYPSSRKHKESSAICSLWEKQRDSEDYELPANEGRKKKTRNVHLNFSLGNILMENEICLKRETISGEYCTINESP